MEQNTASEPVPMPKYRCSGKGCLTLVERRGYCTPCHRNWEVAHREHRRAYARSRTAGVPPPRLKARTRAAQADKLAERARAKVLAAYGLACSVCGKTQQNQLVIVATAHDGGPTAPHDSGKPFYDTLERAGYPRSGLIGGRMHQIAVRCKTCQATTS